MLKVGVLCVLVLATTSYRYRWLCTYYILYFVWLPIRRYTQGILHNIRPGHTDNCILGAGDLHCSVLYIHIKTTKQGLEMHARECSAPTLQGLTTDGSSPPLHDLVIMHEHLATIIIQEELLFMCRYNLFLAIGNLQLVGVFVQADIALFLSSGSSST